MKGLRELHGVDEKLVCGKCPKYGTCKIRDLKAENTN